jgi:hypothetical protein
MQRRGEDRLVREADTRNQNLTAVKQVRRD